MATEYHLTPEGPRRCSVDKGNPRSKGCPFGGTHFDSFEDAMEVYTEDLKATFGDFHVLVRPSAKEKFRRAGYQRLDSIEKAKADPQVQAAVRTLKILSAKAREAAQEIKSNYQQGVDSVRASSLPEDIATEPLATISSEDREAEALSEEVFSTGSSETLSDFSSRISSGAGATSFSLAPIDSSKLENARVMAEAREAISKAPARRRTDKFRAYRSATRRRVHTAKAQARMAFSSGSARAQQKLSSTGYAVRASASLARDTAELRARVAAARVQDRAQDFSNSAREIAARMSIPAGHIRPGDTFDGTTVRSVEAVGEGRVKISYQAKPGGPILAATVPGDRSMKVDRKTRREARNSLISSRLAKPIARTKALSQRVAKVSEAQLSLFGELRSKDSRLSAIDSSILRHERELREREIIDRLRSFRTTTKERALQLS